MSISYALLPDRVKAAFIDSVILVAMMYGFSEFMVEQLGILTVIF